MKPRPAGILLVALPLVVFAAEEAPPKELLEHLDFFQNFELVQDPHFLAQAGRDELDVKPSTGPVSEGGNNDADL